MRASKAAMRSRAGARRDGLSRAERAALSVALSARLTALLDTYGVHTVGLYAALPSEPDVASVAAGRDALWPRCIGRDLEFARAREEDLAPGRFGIPEPAGSAIALAGVQALVVPGLAFTTRGGRLGRGRGYYDRVLAALPDEVLRVGVCYDWELVERVPLEPHDADVAVVVTDTRTVRVGDASGVSWKS